MSSSNTRKAPATFAEFEVYRAKLSDRQRRWLVHKARWEGMTQWAVLSDWTPLPDAELTPCGVSACYGCPTCIEESA